MNDDKLIKYSLPSLVLEPVIYSELGGFYPYVLKKLANGDIKVVSLNEEVINDDNDSILDDALNYAYFVPVSYTSGMMVDDRAIFACLTDGDQIVAYEVINGFSNTLEDYIVSNPLELTLQKS